MYHGCSFSFVKHDPQRASVWVQIEREAEEQGQKPWDNMTALMVII